MAGRGRPFKKGQSGNPKGKPKGVGNKVTNALREEVIAAASLAGDMIAEKRGGDWPGGFVGYLLDLALTEKKTMGGIIGRCIPASMKLDVGVTLEQLVTESYRAKIVDVEPEQVTNGEAKALPEGENGKAGG